MIVHKGSAPLNDYSYALTDVGRDRALIYNQTCSYVGPAPVPLMDYVLSAEAQTIRAESPKRRELQEAFQDISIDEQLFESLGPAINSGAGLFLYGQPGNGKSTLAQRITQCFGHEIWVPHAIFEDGQIIKLFDAAYHQRLSRRRYLAQRRQSRSQMGPHPAANSGRWRRVDDGFFRDSPRSSQ